MPICASQTFLCKTCDRFFNEQQVFSNFESDNQNDENTDNSSDVNEGRSRKPLPSELMTDPKSESLMSQPTTKNSKGNNRGKRINPKLVEVNEDAMPIRHQVEPTKFEPTKSLMYAKHLAYFKQNFSLEQTYASGLRCGTELS